jgi:Bacterial nucleoid DNA-binding protein
VGRSGHPDVTIAHLTAPVGISTLLFTNKMKELALANATLTRVGLIDALVKEVGLARPDCALLLESVFEEITTALAAKDDVKLARFGGFHVRDKRPRVGRNPKTGETAAIKARRVVTFRPSHILRARLGDAAAMAEG